MAKILNSEGFVAGNDQINAKQLGAGIGVSVSNMDTSHGDMRGIKAPATVHTLTGISGQVKSIYRWGRDTLSDTAYWVGSTDDLDFARSMLAEDATERTYITGGGAPRYFDSATLGTPPYPTATVRLGIPTPSGAMTLAAGVVGDGTLEDRVYIDTFVRGIEESAPNPNTATINIEGGSTVAISNLAPVPSGTHGITKRRIYVFTGTGQFQRCIEQLATLTTATDTGARGAVLATGGKDDVDPGSAYLEPPDDMIGLTELWNGMMLGGLDNSYLVCVAYTPHAWPLKYRYTIPDTFVGAATYGQTVVIVTTGLPRVSSGSSPGALSSSPIYLREAGLSKRSVKGVGHGVCWASNNGLCYYGQRGAFNITKNFISREAWRALNPAGIVGAVHEQFYIGIYSATKAFMIDTLNPQGVVWVDIGGYGAFEDSLSGDLFIVTTGNVIQKWEAGAQLAAVFKSKIHRTSVPHCADFVRIEATTFPVGFKLWADGTLRGDVSVANREPVRLPSGYRAELWQYELTGAGPIEGVALTSDVKELP